VSGDSPVRVGDKVSVSFQLTNVGKSSVTFDDKNGVFAAAKDPDGKSTTFGSTYQGKTLKSKEFMTLKTDITLDKEGEWVLWASYCIKVEKETKCGPEEWHACKEIPIGKSDAHFTFTPMDTRVPTIDVRLGAVHAPAEFRGQGNWNLSVYASDPNGIQRIRITGNRTVLFFTSNESGPLPPYVTPSGLITPVFKE